MALTFLLDESLPGRLRRALQYHNANGVYPIDAVRVGDSPDLPLGSTDPVILLWAEREARIVVTLDETTMPPHLAEHLRTGHHSPGVLVVRKSSSIPQVVSQLAAIAYASDAWEWQDHIDYIP